jgi:hypothetical protein
MSLEKIANTAGVLEDKSHFRGLGDPAHRSRAHHVVVGWNDDSMVQGNPAIAPAYRNERS